MTEPIAEDYAVSITMDGTQVVICCAAKDHGCTSEERFVEKLDETLGLIHHVAVIKGRGNPDPKYAHRVTFVTLKPGCIVQYLGPWKDYVQAYEEAKKQQQQPGLPLVVPAGFTGKVVGRGRP